MSSPSVYSSPKKMKLEKKKKIPTSRLAVFFPFPGTQETIFYLRVAPPRDNVGLKLRASGVFIHEPSPPVKSGTWTLEVLKKETDKVTNLWSGFLTLNTRAQKQIYILQVNNSKSEA